MTKKLRFWKHADAGWFRDLDYKCFPTDEPFLNGENYHWWVVDDGDGIVGYAGLYVDGDTVQFCRAGVLPNYRRFGYHRVLIEARLRWARKHGFLVAKTYARLDNPRSVHNLKAAGFKHRNNIKEGYVNFRRVIGVS